MVLGRFDEALTEMRRAIELDPFSGIIRANTCRVFVSARQYDRAIEECGKAVERNPNFVGLTDLGDAYAAKKMTREAIAEYQAMAGLGGSNSLWALVALTRAQALAGPPLRGAPHHRGDENSRDESLRLTCLYRDGLSDPRRQRPGFQLVGQGLRGSFRRREIPQGGSHERRPAGRPPLRGPAAKGEARPVTGRPANVESGHSDVDPEWNAPRPLRDPRPDRRRRHGRGVPGEGWRLGRDVAIKVLPASFSEDADRLRRFEQEARAAGALNHPNITAVYDIGTHDGAPYVVQELLEGETLRTALSGGKLAQRKAIDYALQIAHGLAAAHEKGIVHRDLKPENLFVTNDGRVKILDFGLAKLTHNEARPDATGLPTATGGTEPGVVLGTLGYMSPEQVKGKPADARSDIFSFGAILYEMLSGRRAFHGDSAAETMSAILREEPPDLSVTNQSVSPGLERIVRHAIEKNPEQRFHSAHDVAFALEALSGLSVPRLEASRCGFAAGPGRSRPSAAVVCRARGGAPSRAG